MKLETVTVCVNYGDFLAVTAPQNRGLFDRWVIVTTEADEETREVCRKHNLETVLTNDFYMDGPDQFAKARGINRGLEVLSGNSWHLHMDADIVLPSTFRQLLEVAQLDTSCIYGWDRVLVKGWEAWKKVKLPYNNHDYHCRINIPGEIGTRWVSSTQSWVPIGFSQLFHTDATEWRGMRQKMYPFVHNTAARCDCQFGMLFDRHKRVFLPDIICLHLESELDSKLGANWLGRTTKRFGPVDATKTGGPS